MKIDENDANPEVAVPLDSNKIVVFWQVDKEKVTTEDIKQVQVVASRVGAGRAILIVKETSPLARKEEKENTFIQLEIFTLDDLQVNITHHKLVPRHEVLSYNEKQDLLKKYRIQDSQLPKIYQTDPVAKYFGVTRGEVMKITRESQTAGRYVTYRITI